MNWQQPAALLIVAITASVFAISALRRRRRGALKLDGKGGCGCSSGSLDRSTLPRFVVSGRKGESATVSMRSSGGGFKIDSKPPRT